MKLKFKGILFDLDGVIADTSTYHFEAWKLLVEKYYSRMLPTSLEGKTKGVSRSQSLQVILDYLGETVDQETFAKYLAEKNNLYLHLLTALTPANLLPNIGKLLKELKGKQIKIGLASSSLNAPLILEKLQITSFFDIIVDPTLGEGKPAPDIFLNGAKGLGLLPSECIGIEDSKAGITALAKAQIISIGIGESKELFQADFLVTNTNELTYSYLKNL